MATTKVQRIMTQPINLIFRFLQSKARIQIWLFEQKDLRIEGRIILALPVFVATWRRPGLFFC
ncbi:small nuclear ribonucleoprotein E-like [Phalaenopsis equestris]|uniref:small nuclear ribonucleoprotein E-like n=1 Tax=Phalaenopsis equestris TaxID=78828 RepID=UPI0009E514FE|nr:small nuclear ribonucleoprotein E-like [Phalaenopsis equestris]